MFWGKKQGYLDAEDEEAKASTVTVGGFDYVFKGSILSFAKGTPLILSGGVPTGGESALNRGVSITCMRNSIEFSERVGSSIDARDSLILGASSSCSLLTFSFDFV